MSGLVVQADRLRRLALVVLLGLVGGLLASCSAPSSGAAPLGAATADQTAPRQLSPGHSGRARTPPAQDTAAQTTLDAVAHAVRAGDRDAFQRQLSPRDPAAAAPAAGIFRLAALPLTSLSLRLRPVEHDLPRSRQELLGPDAFVRQVSVTWRLTGDVGQAQHLIWLTFVPEGAAARIAGTGDGPPGRTPQPLWMIEPLTVVGRRHTVVLAGPGRPSTDWLRAGDAAVAAVSSRLHGGAGARWNGRLVFELPGSRQAFERVLGVVPGSYTQIAAVAWPEGPDPATAAVRIVVNPVLASRLDEQSLGVLVTHEATHVATRSAASPAPTWLVEGFADYLAYQAYPRTAERAAAALLGQVSADGPPRRLPTDASFSPGATGLENAYAQSWLACRYLARTYSPTSLARFYRAVDSGDTVDAALESEFGLTERTFTARWAASLESAARQRDPHG